MDRRRQRRLAWLALAAVWLAALAPFLLATAPGAAGPPLHACACRPDPHPLAECCCAAPGGHARGAARLGPLSCDRSDAPAGVLVRAAVPALLPSGPLPSLPASRRACAAPPGAAPLRVRPLDPLTPPPRASRG